jgi:hypothetical protein
MLCQVRGDTDMTVPRTIVWRVTSRYIVKLSMVKLSMSCSGSIPLIARFWGV